MRKIALIAPLLTALFLSHGTASADQLADIKQRGTLVCGTLGTAEPFSFPNPQTREIQGYDIDYCAAIAKSLGVKLEIKPVSVPARIPELQQVQARTLPTCTMPCAVLWRKSASVTRGSRQSFTATARPVGRSCCFRPIALEWQVRLCSMDPRCLIGPVKPASIRCAWQQG